MLKRIFILLLFIAVSFSRNQAQLTFSPYSRYGLGEVLDPGSTRNFSMGGAGVALYDGAAVNRLNPASYGDLKVTSMDFNSYGGYRLLRTNAQSRWVPNGGIHNISFGFAARKNYGFVLGLAPYSATNYRIITEDSLLIDSTSQHYYTTYSADGGLNQFYIGFGMKFFNRINLGLNGVYAFGNTNYKWSTDFVSDNYNTVHIRRRVSLGGVIPQAGIQAGDTIRIHRNVNQTKEINRQKKNLDHELGFLAKEDKRIDRDKSSFEEDVVKLNQKKAEIEAEQKSIQGQIDPLMANESENEKTIGKLQEKKFKLEKKRKRIEQKIKRGEKEISREKQSVQAQRDQINKSKVNLDRKLAEIAAGTRTDTIRKTTKLLTRIGVTYQPAYNLKGTRLVEFDNSSIGDTAGTELNSKVNLPARIGAGLSIGVGSKWIITADATVQDWSKFDYFGETNRLKNSMRISLGGEYINRFYSAKYSDRIAWRFGAWYEKTNLNIEGNPVQDIGISFGVGLPVGRMMYPGTSSRINVGVGLGMRGSLQDNLLQESYISLRLGVNLNDIWFIRPKID